MFKYIVYFFVLLRYKWRVFVQCCKLGIPGRGIVHGMSYFYPDEFFAHAQKHHVEKKTKGRVAVPRVVAVRHSHRSKYEWRYWVQLLEDGCVTTLVMPEKYVKEWVASVRAANPKALTHTIQTAFIHDLRRCLVHPAVEPIILSILDCDSDGYQFPPVATREAIYDDMMGKVKPDASVCL